MASEAWAFGSIGDTPGADDIYKPQRNRNRPARLRSPTPAPQLPAGWVSPHQIRVFPSALYTDSPNCPSASFPAVGPVSLEVLGRHLPAGSE